MALSGIIERRTYAGPDAPERGWYLRLFSPIDVEKRKADADPDSETERNVKILHLTFDPESPAGKFIKTSKARVRLEGTLFHALSGHNHSRVLLNVTRAVEAGK